MICCAPRSLSACALNKLVSSYQPQSDTVGGVGTCLPTTIAALPGASRITEGIIMGWRWKSAVQPT